MNENKLEPKKHSNERILTFIVIVLLFSVFLAYMQADKIARHSRVLKEELNAKNNAIQHYKRETEITNNQLKIEINQRQALVKQLELLQEIANKPVPRCQDTPPLASTASILLHESKISNNPYTPAYDCKDYANDYIKYLHDRDIFSCVGTIVYNANTAHNIVLVNTSDKGLLFVDPARESFYNKQQIFKVHHNVKRIATCYGTFYPGPHPAPTP